MIGSGLGPYVEQLTDWITTAAVTVRKWIDDHRGLVVVLFKVAGAIVLAGVGFSIFGRILGGIAGGLGWIVSGIRLLGTLVSGAGTLLAGAWSSVRAIAAIGPIRRPSFADGLVAAAVVGLAGYFLYASGPGGNALEWLKGVLGGWPRTQWMRSGPSATPWPPGIALAAKVVWSLLKMEFQSGVNALTEVWIGFKEIFMHA